MGKHLSFPPVFSAVLRGSAVCLREELSPCTSSCSGDFWAGAKITLPVKCRGEGSNSHSACVCTAGPPWAGCALPLSSGAEIGGKSLGTSSYSESQSLFNFESQRKPPQCEGVIPRPALYGRFTEPCPIWWRLWACTNHQRGTSLQLVTAMAKIASEAFMPSSALSWMHDAKCGIPPDSKVFQFQLLVISKVYLISVI